MQRTFQRKADATPGHLVDSCTTATVAPKHAPGITIAFNHGHVASALSLRYSEHFGLAWATTACRRHICILRGAEMGVRSREQIGIALGKLCDFSFARSVQ